jgi:hypothetical protein
MHVQTKFYSRHASKSRGYHAQHPHLRQLHPHQADVRRSVALHRREAVGQEGSHPIRGHGIPDDDPVLGRCLQDTG